MHRVQPLHEVRPPAATGPSASASTAWPPGTTPGSTGDDGALAPAAGRRPGQGPVLRAVHARPGRAGPRRLPGRRHDQGRGAGPRPRASGCAPRPSPTARTCASSGAPRAGRASCPRRMELHPAEVVDGEGRPGRHGRGRRARHGGAAARHGPRERRPAPLRDRTSTWRRAGSPSAARRRSLRVVGRRWPGLAHLGRPAARRRRPGRGAGQRPRAPRAVHRRARRRRPASCASTPRSGRWRRARRWRSTTRSTPTPWSARASPPDRGCRRRRPGRQRPAGGGGAGRRAARADRPPQRAVPHARRAGDPRRRVRPPRRGAAAARGGPSRAGHARLADATRWAPRRRASSRGPPPGAHDEPRQRVRRGRAAGLGASGCAARTRLSTSRRWPSRASPRSTAWPCRSPTSEGRFVQAATRGDGVTGEDVTANVATVGDVPEELAKAGGPYPDVLEVRGEIYMPVAEFEAMNKRQAERGRAPLRQPAQLGGRRAAPEGPRRSRPRGRCTSGPTRSASSRARRPRAAWPAATQTDDPGPAGQGRASRSAPTPARSTGIDGGRRPLPGAGRGAPPRPGLRDRRRGDQGRRPGPARRARRHLAGAAVGHRLQVPARGAHDPAARHHGLDRPHRPGHAVRPARAGLRRRLDGRRGHAAQRGPGGGQGRAARRPRRRAQGGRRHPRGGRPGARGPRRAEAAQAEVEVPDRRARPAASRSSACPARATPTAPTSTARPSGCSASSHFASRGGHGHRGPGRGARAPARRRPGSSTTRPTSTT